MTRTLARIAVVGAAAVAVLSAQTTPPQSPADHFYTAIRNADTPALVALLNAGADVNVVERRGGATPLMNAAAFGSVDAMKRLLDKGADVNARSAAGATALMWAATDLAKVRLLVEHGADVNAVSETGRSALLLAALSDGSADIVRLLLSRGANARIADNERTTVLLAATFGNDPGTVDQVLRAGADINATNVAGMTPLMNAASHGNVDVVKALINRGAHVNAVSAPPFQKVKNGTIAIGSLTPLILAAAYGPPPLVKMLLEAGADVNAIEARGMTPLMYAAATDHGYQEIVRMLLDAGADLHVRTPAGETATAWAVKSGTTPTVAALRRAGGTVAPVASRAVPSAAPVPLRPALERSVGLLERSSGTFFVNSACGACHSQNVTDIAVAAARRSGVKVDEAAAAQRATGAAAAFGATATRLLERFDGPSIDILLYTLGGLAAAGHPADRATDAMVFNVAAQQWQDGRWHSGGIPRPPIEDGDFSRTALAIRALTAYRPEGRGAELRARVDRATRWLQTANPVTAEDRAFRLLGLAWGGASRTDLERSAQAIAVQQNSDGGWSQRAEMASDAYATGLTLFALHEANVVNRSDQSARAITYLLSTQRADGSWLVRSRSPKFQPYFDGGFPYEHDQWISAMATGWAAAALASGL